MRYAYAAAASTALSIAVAVLVAYLWRSFPRSTERTLALAAALVWICSSLLTTIAWFVAAGWGFNEYGRLVQSWVQPTGRMAAAVTLLTVMHYRHKQNIREQARLQTIRDEWGDW